MIQNTIQQWIKKTLIQAFPSDKEYLTKIDIPLRTSFREQYGDFSSSLPFIISSHLQLPPQECAKRLKQYLEDNLISEITKIEVKNKGYLNFFLAPTVLSRELENIYNQIITNHNWPLLSSKKETVIVEFSSPNIAKPMHVGHLRSTVIGNALANLYNFAGYRTIRWNYLGDWGTQFGKLIAAYKLWGDAEKVKKDSFYYLLSLYQKFHQETKNNPTLEEQGRKEFKKLEEGDRENRKLWQWFRQISLKEFHRIYTLLDVNFDIEDGESTLTKELPSLIQQLQKDKLTQISQGALIIPLTQFDLPPALLKKSDGATLYFTRDLASLIYRVKKYHPQKILYVVANEQSLYFQQLFAVAKLLGITPQTKLFHIKFGLVLNSQKKKFSTREGNMVPLQELINEGLDQSLKIIKEKHPDWSQAQQEKTAQIITIDALKFNDLKNSRLADVIFSWKQMLNFQGNSSVYLQYTYARLAKIVTKADINQRTIHSSLVKLNFSRQIEKTLIKKILDFPSVIQQSLDSQSPHLLANYLLSLADLSNGYYEQVPVLKEENKFLKIGSLVLITAILSILKIGTKILGVRTLEEV